MRDVIEALPGVDLPVGEVTNRLDRMWDSDSTTGSPSAFRALQMNVVLHFGWGVTPEEALAHFDSLLTFAQRYPARIIVLCPSRAITDGAMRAKLFSQCYIGESHREMCCCEALLLAYQPENSGYLANQVSVWLTPDLPTYHWFCGVPGTRIEEYFDNLLVGVRRAIYDSSYEKKDLNQLDWPNPSRVGDLAMARLLPVRQAIGQFLSGYPIEELCQKLSSVTVHHAESKWGEGMRLIEWIRDCLGECKGCADCSALRAKYVLQPCDTAHIDCSLALEFTYADNRYFKWRKFATGSMSEIEFSLGKSEEKISTRVKPLGAEQMLAEALFF